jgi:hypothetical protein
LKLTAHSKLVEGKHSIVDLVVQGLCDLLYYFSKTIFNFLPQQVNFKIGQKLHQRLSLYHNETISINPGNNSSLCLSETGKTLSFMTAVKESGNML